VRRHCAGGTCRSVSTFYGSIAFPCAPAEPTCRSATSFRTACSPPDPDRPGSSAFSGRRGGSMERKWKAREGGYPMAGGRQPHTKVGIALVRGAFPPFHRRWRELALELSSGPRELRGPPDLVRGGADPGVEDELLGRLNGDHLRPGQRGAPQL